MAIDNLGVIFSLIVSAETEERGQILVGIVRIMADLIELDSGAFDEIWSDSRRIVFRILSSSPSSAPAALRVSDQIFFFSRSNRHQIPKIDT